MTDVIDSDEATAIEHGALRLLASREHTRLELRRKLARHHDEAQIDPVLDDLERRRLLDRLMQPVHDPKTRGLVKVVILGQDPYHGEGQAHGLCFSVRPGVAVPPSLQNIYREIGEDLGVRPPANGNLQAWADQGVLLLNAVLTVERGHASAHQGKGWERFTDRVAQALNAEREHLVFLLWGSYAMKKGSVIDRDRHLVLTAPHPSPLSAHRGFFGCRHFSKANAWLEQHGMQPIRWAWPG